MSTWIDKSIFMQCRILQQHFWNPNVQNLPCRLILSKSWNSISIALFIRFLLSTWVHYPNKLSTGNVQFSNRLSVGARLSFVPCRSSLQ